MGQVHKGIENKYYGKMHTDEEFTIRIHHVNKLIKQGYPVRYYSDKYNRVRVYRDNVWWVIDDLWEFESLYKPEGV